MDLLGLEKLSEALPKEAINEATKTVCEAFEKLILPLTATTVGVGQLLQTKFETLNLYQKIIATKCLEEAKEKVGSRQVKKSTVVKPQVMCEALDRVDQQTDESMRGLWANLLAREFIEGDVHPEIAKLLGHITTQDALLLISIAEKEPKSRYILVLKVIRSQFNIPDFGGSVTFNLIHLSKLGLIKLTEQIWHLTATGHEFMRCVGGFDE